MTLPEKFSRKQYEIDSLVSLNGLLKLLSSAPESDRSKAVDNDFDFQEHFKLFNEFIEYADYPKSWNVLQTTCFGHRVNPDLIELARKEIQDGEDNASNV